jgi:hypothetical protein
MRLSEGFQHERAPIGRSSHRGFPLGSQGVSAPKMYLLSESIHFIDSVLVFLIAHHPADQALHFQVPCSGWFLSGPQCRKNQSFRLLESPKGHSPLDRRLRDGGSGQRCGAQHGIYMQSWDRGPHTPDNFAPSRLVTLVRAQQQSPKEHKLVQVRRSKLGPHPSVPTG